MSALQGGVRQRVQQNGSRAAHRVCTRVTNALLALTRMGWTQRLVAPNTPQVRHYSARAASSSPVAAGQSQGQADDAATPSPVSSADPTAPHSTPRSACAASAPRRVRHVLVTVHGYLGLPRPFFLFRAPAIKSVHTLTRQ